MTSRTTARERCNSFPDLLILRGYSANSIEWEFKACKDKNGNAYPWGLVYAVDDKE